MNYANIAWGSTHKSKLLPLYRKQKQAVRAIFFKDKMAHRKPLFTEINALNLYQLNLFQILNFMYKTCRKLVPDVFQTLFVEKINKYTLKSQGNYAKPFKKSKLTQFSISYRGPHVWNNLLDKQTELKSIINQNTFKQKLKVLIIPPSPLMILKCSSRKNISATLNK